jgi:tetratricopeptide (TPR) repeat protein
VGSARASECTGSAHFGCAGFKFSDAAEAVTNAPSIDPVEFIEHVQPLLEKQDLQGLLALLRSRWTKEQIKDVLAGKHRDARKVAALALGLVGSRCCITPLAEQLRDPDPVVNEMAEHALWSIWFRCGTGDANALLTRGAAALDRRDFEEAEKLFTRAIAADPAFAESYNQRAIVRYLAERYEESLADCREAVERMPCHFGAWAGLGHCLAHVGRCGEAIRAYDKALEINPHLRCIAEAVATLKGTCHED